MLHRVLFLELADDACNRGGLLADGDIDTLNTRATLVDDRVDRDGRLARLAVADNELALAAADRHHRVDGLEAGLDRLVDRLALDDARGDALDRVRLVAVDRALAVDRITECVDDAAQEAPPDRHFEDAARRLDRGAFRDVLVVTEDNSADGVLLEVEREAERVARELEHLTVGGVGQAVNADDTVGNGNYGADVARFRGRFEILDALFNQLADFRSFECHDCIPL